MTLKGGSKKNNNKKKSLFLQSPIMTPQWLKPTRRQRTRENTDVSMQVGCPGSEQKKGKEQR